MLFITSKAWKAVLCPTTSDQLTHFRSSPVMRHGARETDAVTEDSRAYNSIYRKRPELETLQTTSRPALPWVRGMGEKQLRGTGALLKPPSLRFPSGGQRAEPGSQVLPTSVNL